MNIEDLTLKQIREIQSLSGNKDASASHPFKVGENYFIRTVTMIIIGHLEAVHGGELMLSSASWIADTGRFHNALKDGELAEVEPFTHNVIVGRGAIVDATTWAHALPREQK